jgi:tRNA G18 (ribose-2'-O)-methylase SpoU
VVVEHVDDPADPRLDEYRDLKDAELRRRRGLFIVESRDVVRRLLGSARFRTRSVLLTPPGLEALRASLEASTPGVSILLTRPAIVRAVVGYNFHRGCLAVAERGSEPSLADLMGEPGPRLLLALEGVTNPDNVGGAFRNAMAFAVDGVLMSPGCADPLYRKTVRVSIGGSLSVPFARTDDWPDALRRLRAGGYTLIALTPRPAAMDIADFVEQQPVPRRAVLVIGTEATGLADSTLRAADAEIRIPMAPGVDSLNVSTACGIALHRFRSSV